MFNWIKKKKKWWNCFQNLNYATITILNSAHGTERTPWSHLQYRLNPLCNWWLTAKFYENKLPLRQYLRCHIKSQWNVYINKLQVTLNNIFCSSLNFSMGSTEEKFISRDTARHFSTFFGTRASCSISGTDLEKFVNM